MSNEIKELYEFENFRLDVGEHKLKRLDGRSSNGSLREKAFEVLTHLLRNSGRLVSREELISAVWADTVVEEANLSKAIHAIRQFLGEDAGGPKYIETVPKHGYRFVAEVRRVQDENAEVDALYDPVAAQVRGADAGSRSQALPPTRQYSRDLPEIPSAPFTSDAFHVDADDSRKSFRTLWIGTMVLIGVLGIAGLLAARNWPGEASLRNSTSANEISETAHSRAYDLYVRGKVKAGVENPVETEAAIKLLEEAVALDPGLAEAHAQLARVYNTKAFKFATDNERGQFYENAEVAIEKALALNPDLAEAHFARGLILWNSAKRFPHEQAIRSYKRSLELDPRQDETHQQLSMVYAHIGMMEDAKRSLSKALELNPNNTMARYRVGNYLVWEGKSEEALAVLQTVPSEVSPLLVERITAEAMIQTGRLREAEVIVDSYLGKNPSDEGGSFTSLKALLLAKAGKHQEAHILIERAIEIGKGFGHFHHTVYNIASAHAAMNETEAAVKWLDAAAADGFPNYTYFEIDPNLDNIRTEPSFIAFMARLKEQWVLRKERIQSLD